MLMMRSETAPDGAQIVHFNVDAYMLNHCQPSDVIARLVVGPEWSHAVSESLACAYIAEHTRYSDFAQELAQQAVAMYNAAERDYQTGPDTAAGEDFRKRRTDAVAALLQHHVARDAWPAWLRG